VDNLDSDLIGLTLTHGDLFTSIFVNSLVLICECPLKTTFDDFLLPPPERITSKTVEHVLQNICQAETEYKLLD
jgi:hypothetical protein